MANANIFPHHILGGIAFEARAVSHVIDAHAAGQPLSLDTLREAIERMQGLISVLSVTTPAPEPDAVTEVAEAA